MKQNNRFRVKTALLIGLTLLMIACKSTKETARVQLQSAEIEERIGYILNHSIDYETFAASAFASIKMEGEGNANYACSAQLRIIKDECIQLAFTAPFLGELYRFTITPERITVVDRRNKQYISELMSTIKANYPFDFNYYDLEALFTNRIFMTGQESFEPSFHQHFNLLEDGYNAFLNYRDKQYISYTFTSDYSHRIINTAIHHEKEQIFMSWDYSNFKTVGDKQVFPMKEDIVISLPESTVQLTLDFKNIDLKKSFTIDYNIPSKYQEIPFDKLLNTF